MKKSEETRIVLDCDFDKIEMILQQVFSNVSNSNELSLKSFDMLTRFEQAHEIDLMTDYHNYLVTR